MTNMPQPARFGRATYGAAACGVRVMLSSRMYSSPVECLLLQTPGLQTEIGFPSIIREQTAAIQSFARPRRTARARHAETFGRRDDPFGNPHRAQMSQFELFELVLFLKLDKRFPVEQLEAAASQSISTLPPLLLPSFVSRTRSPASELVLHGAPAEYYYYVILLLSLLLS